jgi:hypothetical protein
LAIELNTLPSNNIENINTNFERVEIALQDAVSRSGDTPNQMNADLDMNSGNVLNVGRIDSQEIYLDGVPIIDFPAIAQVLEISDEIITVAGIDNQVVAVANNSGNINTVSTNMPTIVNVNNSLPAINRVDSNIATITNIDNNLALINDVNDISDEIIIVAGIKDEVVAVANIDTDVTTVASISDEVVIVANNIDDINEAVDNLPDLAGKLNKDGSNGTPDLGWAMMPLGMPIPVFDDLTGFIAPPTDKTYRYIKLTAADLYNDGVLIGEVVSGTSPNLTATAVIDLIDSPFNGQTISLINTDRRFIRAGLSGEKQQSQNLAHNHTGTALTAGAHQHTSTRANSASALGANVMAQNNSNGTWSTPSAGAHTHTLSIDDDGGTEARPANIGATYYMRIK